MLARLLNAEEVANILKCRTTYVWQMMRGERPAAGADSLLIVEFAHRAVRVPLNEVTRVAVAKGMEKEMRSFVAEDVVRRGHLRARTTGYDPTITPTITSRELAALWSASPSWINNLCRTGELPVLKTKKGNPATTHVLPTSELETYVKERTRRRGRYEKMA